MCDLRLKYIIMQPACTLTVDHSTQGVPIWQKISIELRNDKSGLPSPTERDTGICNFSHVTTWKKEFRMLLAFTELLGNFQMRNLNGMNFSHLIHSPGYLEFRGIKEAWSWIWSKIIFTILIVKMFQKDVPTCVIAIQNLNVSRRVLREIESSSLYVNIFYIIFAEISIRDKVYLWFNRKTESSQI